MTEIKIKITQAEIEMLRDFLGSGVSMDDLTLERFVVWEHPDEVKSVLLKLSHELQLNNIKGSK